MLLTMILLMPIVLVCYWRWGEGEGTKGRKGVRRVVERGGRAPNGARFVRLCRTRTEIRPLQVCPVRGIDPLNGLARAVFTS